MLFPELERPGSGLVGIARLANESNLLEQKRSVEYREIEIRRLIGRASGRKMPFEWTINPYRGCEFGCKYCYARYTHEFMELRETEQFERSIFAKRFDAASFRRELARVPPHECVAIGTATDPYQPAERRFGVTRSILEVLAEERGRSFSLTTKSDIVARDSELLAAIARRNVLHVLTTITTTDERLARVLEPFAPRPGLRLGAVRALTDAGVRVAILACPVMPLINDSPASLTAVAAAARHAGAVYMYGNVLFLKPCAQKAFFPLLDSHFPHLVRRYRERYEGKCFLRGPYVDTIRQRMHDIREEYGLTQNLTGYMPEEWLGDPQMALFDL